MVFAQSIVNISTLYEMVYLHKRGQVTERLFQKGLELAVNEGAITPAEMLPYTDKELWGALRWKGSDRVQRMLRSVKRRANQYRSGIVWQSGEQQKKENGKESVVSHQAFSKLFPFRNPLELSQVETALAVELDSTLKQCCSSQTLLRKRCSHQTFHSLEESKSSPHSTNRILTSKPHWKQKRSVSPETRASSSMKQRWIVTNFKEQSQHSLESWRKLLLLLLARNNIVDSQNHHSHLSSTADRLRLDLERLDNTL
jgi:HD superfamily phosphohydrolase